MAAVTAERQAAFALERGWQQLEFVQTEGDDYAKDLGLFNPDGTENPALVVYRREGDKVRLFWSSGMKSEMADAGQDPRDAPDIGALWSILDLTPEGQGSDWYPQAVVFAVTNKPVGWFEIYVQDMKRAKAFYEAVFSMQLEKLDGADSSLEMWSFPGPVDDGNGASGALVKMNGGPSNGNGVIVYFTCKDCSAELGRVPANGGKVTKEKFPLDKGHFAALITDTEGNVVGLHSMP